MSTRNKLLTVAEYDALGESGALSQDDRVELIDGRITPMRPVVPRHAWCGTRLGNTLTPKLWPRVIVSMRQPLVVDGFTEVHPEITLLRQRPDDYDSELPQARDALALVEVATAAAGFRIHEWRKVDLYCKAGIPEVWLIDLHQSFVEARREPGSRGYSRIERRGRGETLAFDAFPDLPIEVSAILGRP
jgi:Uma2 family endonuclease